MEPNITSISLMSLPFSTTQKEKLNQAGFRSVSDLQGIGIIELSKELSLSKEEALTIIQIANCNNKTPEKKKSSNLGKRAFDLLVEEGSQIPIVSYCQAFDEMLGGGIPIGKLTEICGAPGLGKTQFGTQLSIDVQIPEKMGGVEGGCIYIDTEGSFIIDRTFEIATATVEHLKKVAQNEEQQNIMRTFTVEKILENIHYFRVHDFVEQIGLINALPFILKDLNIKLIVVDSITFQFRHDFSDNLLRTRLLSNMAQNLIGIAEKFNVAVVLTNQMTTKPGNDNKLVPALGETWAHCCTNRIILNWKDGSRYAELIKSNSKKSALVQYNITSDGIR